MCVSKIKLRAARGRAAIGIAQRPTVAEKSKNTSHTGPCILYIKIRIIHKCGLFKKRKKRRRTAKRIFLSALDNIINGGTSRREGYTKVLCFYVMMST